MKPERHFFRIGLPVTLFGDLSPVEVTVQEEVEDDATGVSARINSHSAKAQGFDY